jgi:hypothetical protein
LARANRRQCLSCRVIVRENRPTTTGRDEPEPTEV